MTLRWPSPPDLGAVPTVTELYAEIARLEFFIGSQAKFIEEQRVLLMDLRLQRDEAIKTAEVLAELRPLITVLRNLSV